MQESISARTGLQVLDEVGAEIATEVVRMMS
jgi:hypothetical protein